MRINTTNIKSTGAPTQAPSKKAKARVTRLNVTQGPSSPPATKKSLSDRDVKYGIRCFQGAVTGGFTALAALCGMLAYEILDQRRNRCDYDPSTCDLLDSEKLSLVTCCVFGTVSACFGIAQGKRLCSKQSP